MRFLIVLGFGCWGLGMKGGRVEWFEVARPVKKASALETLDTGSPFLVF